MSNIPDELAAIQNFKGKYPKQLWYLFFSEMWERFCFYGMRGVLIYFMVNQLMMNEEVANLQYGATQAFVYAFTFIGGLFADKILGYRKSLFWGGILMIFGSCILAFDPYQFFFLGISFTIIGTGFFKPTISTMVGCLYHTDDSRTDAGFSLFYAGVNIGALLGGYLCIAVGKGQLFERLIPGNLRWNVAFGFAAIVMVISLLTFIKTQKSLGPIGLSPLLNLTVSKRRIYEYSTYLGSVAVIPLIILMVSNSHYTDLFMYIIGPFALLYVFFEMRNFSVIENKKMAAALFFILYSIIFWSFFELSGGSLSIFASNNLSNTVLGITLDPNGVNNSANSTFVVIFAVIVGSLWLSMGKRKMEPSSVIKFGVGFLLLAFGFYVFYYTKFFADENGITSLNVFTGGWLFVTLGELCLAPIGLSVTSKLSPQKMQAVMIGLLFLAGAYGQYFAGLLGANIAKASENASNLETLAVYTEGYKQLAFYALIAGVALIVISPLIKKLTLDVR